MGVNAVARAETRDLRDAMVDQLKKRGLEFGPAIEEAFRTVPREVFLPGVALERVYSGDNIITKQDVEGRPISSSSEVGIMIAMAQLLDVAPGHRVLEIGAGTGYNAAILSRLVGERGAITTVDIDPEIAAQARQNLAAAGFHRVAVIAGDGWGAASVNATYDRIEITASVSDLSPSWVAQLTEGGVIVFPFVLRAGMQTVIALRKQGAELVSTGVTPGGFMRLRGQGEAQRRTTSVDEFDVEMSDRLVEDGGETLAALLRPPPRARRAMRCCVVAASRSHFASRGRRDAEGHLWWRGRLQEDLGAAQAAQPAPVRGRAGSQLPRARRRRPRIRDRVAPCELQQCDDHRLRPRQRRPLALHPRDRPATRQPDLA